MTRCALLLAVMFLVGCGQSTGTPVPAKTDLDRYQQALEIYKIQRDIFIQFRESARADSPDLKDQWDDAMSKQIKRVTRAGERLDKAEASLVNK